MSVKCSILIQSQFVAVCRLKAKVYRAYSLEVKQPAHNRKIVGSIPTTLKDMLYVCTYVSLKEGWPSGLKR
jgi:hypothetical protein